jgi:DNA-directed RNA polymerase sigma subunit (sigma70/sigma32)
MEDRNRIETEHRKAILRLARKGNMQAVFAGLGIPWQPAPTVEQQRAVLDQTMDEPVTLAEHLTDPEAPALDAMVIQRIEREQLRRAFATLPSEVRYLFTLRWGLDGTSPRSLGEVARRAGKNQEEIAGLIAPSLRILRHRLEVSCFPSGSQRASCLRRRVPFPVNVPTDGFGRWRCAQISVADPKDGDLAPGHRSRVWIEGCRG